MPDVPQLPERETYTAKQIATRIGTDAKTLRKFFRSAASTVDPVGQGGRYEFDAAMLPKIREEFTKWRTPSRVPRAKATPAPIEEDQEVMELEDDEEELDLEDLANLIEELQEEDDDE